LRAEGHPIDAGTTGENLTIEGLDWSALVPGVRLIIGEAELEITSYVVPCRNITASFANGEFKRIGQNIHPGWSRLYARVLREGTVRVGDAVSMTCTPN
jgi:MOSC domain-containing protein YiiM